MQQFRRGSKEAAWEWRDTEADGDIGIPIVPGVRCLYPPHPALRDICHQDNNGIGLYQPPLKSILTFTAHTTQMNGHYGMGDYIHYQRVMKDKRSPKSIN